MKFKFLKPKRTFEDLINSPDTFNIVEEFEDELFYNSFDEYKSLEEDWSGKPFNVYDIIMVNSATGPRSNMRNPHRVYIISKVIDNNGEITYKGYMISSKINKSNKYSRNKYNIFIDDYGAILSSGNPLPNPVFIDIGEPYEFTHSDLSKNGVKKGVAKKDFIDFIKKCEQKVYSGESTLNCTWENGKGVIT